MDDTMLAYVIVGAVALGLVVGFVREILRWFSGE